MTITVRQETTQDEAAVRAVVARAFREAPMSAPPIEGEDVPGEATLVEWLRASDRYDPRFALVAVGTVDSAGGDADSASMSRGVPVDAAVANARELERENAVIGHVVASWGDVDGTPVLGVGPLSVDPVHQGRGVGSALMHELLMRAADAGESVVVLLGDPAYYARFGFVPALQIGIIADSAWGDYFQACVLGGGGSADQAPFDGPRGEFTYAEPFTRLG